MATYNGSQWVRLQLESILPQLGAADEVIVVDDASRDDTLEVIAGLADGRIKVTHNERNLGVDRTFEKALGLAQGDIIFLSDQDDIWRADKVKTVLAAFDADPKVTLMISDARIVDGEGNEIHPSYFALRGGFVPGVLANILKSKFLGCAMAFRSEVRDNALPFPHPIPGHDMWIGVVNELHGKTRFIDAPLIDYRRHGKNLSPATHQGISQMIKWRWQLIGGIVLHRIGRLRRRSQA
ncbi:MAG: glycosyltransferase family 2 protein [Devosia sp.]